MTKYDKELDTRTEEYEEAMEPDPRAKRDGHNDENADEDENADDETND
jgi:hypothetical protein